MTFGTSDRLMPYREPGLYEYVIALVGLVLCGFVVRGCWEAFNRDVLGWWRVRRRLARLRTPESILDRTARKPTRPPG